MEEGAQETTQVQPSVEDHVSVVDGNITLSPEAEAILEGREPDVPQKEQPEKTPEEPEKKEPETKEPPKEEKAKRKIKWQGQEVDIEPEKEEELLQKGFDYTQKTQALAAERDMITPYVGLVKAMQADPNLQKHIADYLKGDTKKVETVESDDPIEQIITQAEKRAYERVQKELIEPIQKKTDQMTLEQVISSVSAEVRKDPLYPEVDKAMREYIAEMPEVVGRPLFNQLNTDPKSYLETFNKFRTKIAATKKTEAKPETPETLPEPTKRETHAPLLESGDKGGSEPSSKAMNDKIKTLLKRSRGGDFQALGELLEMNALK
jgi:hypothetical protein